MTLRQTSSKVMDYEGMLIKSNPQPVALSRATNADNADFLVSCYWATDFSNLSTCHCLTPGKFNGPSHSANLNAPSKEEKKIEEVLDGRKRCRGVDN